MCNIYINKVSINRVVIERVKHSFIYVTLQNHFLPQRIQARFYIHAKKVAIKHTGGKLKLKHTKSKGKIFCVKRKSVSISPRAE